MTQKLTELKKVIRDTVPELQVSEEDVWGDACVKINLEDVLRTIVIKSRHIGLEIIYGNFLKFSTDEEDGWNYVWDKNGARVKWQYGKPLDEQNEETITFLHEIICK
jgi:hypothetical protein